MEENERNKIMRKKDRKKLQERKDEMKKETKLLNNAIAKESDEEIFEKKKMKEI